MSETGWRALLDDRQRNELDVALRYASQFAHLTGERRPGVHRWLLLVVRLAELLDRAHALLDDEQAEVRRLGTYLDEVGDGGR